MARRISGTGYAPIDLSTLDTPVLIDCNFLVFHMKPTVLHDLVEINPKYLSIDEIIQTWSPVEGKKLNTEGDLA